MSGSQSTPLRTAAESLQWLTFSLSSSIGAPLVVGAALGLAAGDQMLLVQNALLVVGVTTLVQVFAGHRMVLTMVPAILWATVVLSLARFADGSGGPLTGLITDVQGGFLVTALVLIVLALAGAARVLLQLFTPLTISVYLFMLMIQAAGPFMADALAVGVRGPGPEPAATVSSALLLLLFLILSSPRRHPFLRASALPLAIVAAGAVLWLLGGAGTADVATSGAGAAAGGVASVGASTAGSASEFAWLRLPLFPWGRPTFDIAVIVAMVPCVLPVLLSASSAVMTGSQVYDKPMTPQTLRRAVICTGLGTATAAVGGVVAPVPQSESVGFVELTGMRHVLSFAIGMGLVALIGLSPVVSGLLASIPTSLLAAALLVAFSPLAGVAVRTLLSGPLTQRELTIFGLSLLCGIGMFSLPESALQALPEAIRYLLTNGMVTGTVVAMLLEQVVFRRPWPAAE